MINAKSFLASLSADIDVEKSGEISHQVIFENDPETAFNCRLEISKSAKKNLQIKELQKLSKSVQK